MTGAEAARNAPRRQRGMTLVEVLVALLILGMVAGAVLALIGQNTRFVAGAEDQMLAGILADNLMVEALGQEGPLERGVAQAERDFGGRRWLATTTVVETGAGGLVRVEIAVRAASGQTLAEAITLKADIR